MCVCVCACASAHAPINFLYANDKQGWLSVPDKNIHVLLAVVLTSTNRPDQSGGKLDSRHLVLVITLASVIPVVSYTHLP